VNWYHVAPCVTLTQYSTGEYFNCCCFFDNFLLLFFSVQLLYDARASASG